MDATPCQKISPDQVDYKSHLLMALGVWPTSILVDWYSMACGVLWSYFFFKRVDCLRDFFTFGGSGSSSLDLKKKQQKKKRRVDSYNVLSCQQYKKNTHSCIFINATNL